MKLLLDEMWPRIVAEQLRALGHDVVLLAERDDLRTRPDSYVFVVARSEGRAFVTEDVKDYRKLAIDTILGGETHPGLILTTNRTFPRSSPRTPRRLIRSLHRLLVSEVDLSDREHWLHPQEP